METVDSEDHRFRQEARVAESGFEQEFPVVAPALLQNTEVEHRLDERLDVDQTEAVSPVSLERLELFEELQHPLVESGRVVDGGDDFLVALDQLLRVHLGDEVEGEVGIVAGEVEQ